MGTPFWVDEVTNLLNNLVVTKYSEIVGDGASTSFTITHNLDSHDVSVSVWDETTNPPSRALGGLDSVDRDSANQITVGFSIAPGTDSRRIVINA